MNKPKIIVISIISILVLGLFIVIYKTFIVDDKTDQKISQSTVPKLKAKEKFTYEDMMKYREANGKTNSRAKINIEGDTIVTDTLNFKIAGEGQGLFGDSEDFDDNAFIPVEEEIVPRSYSSSSNSGGGGRSTSTRRVSNNDLYNTQDYADAYEEIRNQNDPVTQQLDIQPEEEPRRRRREGFIGSSTSKSALGGVNVIVFGDQVIEAGESLKLRVTNDSKINGVTIPRNSIAYGVVSRGQNRLNIVVSSIQAGGKSIPVNLTAYDATDGMAGLKVTQQEVDYTTDNMKSQAGDEVLNATGVTSLPVIGMLGRGAKELLTRRKTTNSVIVGNNYQLILK